MGPGPRKKFEEIQSTQHNIVLLQHLENIQLEKVS